MIGNDTAITVGGLQGQFELNVRIPLIARNLLQSIHLLVDRERLFAEKCVEGIEANLEGCERSAESTLAVATALNPYIGYDKAAEIVKEAAASGRTLREVAREHGVDEATLDEALDLRKIAAGSSAVSAVARSRSSASRSTTTPCRAPRHGSRTTGRCGCSSARASRGPTTRGPAGGDIGADDVRAHARRQWELGVPRRSSGWPSSRRRSPGGARGRTRRRRAAADGAARRRSKRRAVAARLRRLEPDDPELAASRAVADIAFGRPARRAAMPGARERDAAVGNFPERRLGVGARADGRRADGHRRGRGRRRHRGRRQPPAGRRRDRDRRRRHAAGARRRGLGAAVTAALVDDARRGGADIVFLSAGSDDIARVYGRLGFERVGTAGLAQPAVSS